MVVKLESFIVVDSLFYLSRLGTLYSELNRIGSFTCLLTNREVFNS